MSRRPWLPAPAAPALPARAASRSPFPRLTRSVSGPLYSLSIGTGYLCDIDTFAITR
ncbi:hypothetical protein [Microbispora sp. NPDC049125]|uniref:hypothetical protein n=1 Tax=Microbispora sp. NPDC049125 TaxID=3154929 RepID=UPI00346780E8